MKKNDIEIKDTYTLEEVLKIYEKFDIILNDVIRIYEEEMANIYYQNTFRNKIKRNVKKAFRWRKK